MHLLQPLLAVIEAYGDSTRNEGQSRAHEVLFLQKDISRGLITAHEVMAQYQCDPQTGKIHIFCSAHTRVKRDLPDNDDIISIATD